MKNLTLVFNLILGVVLTLSINSCDKNELPSNVKKNDQNVDIFEIGQKLSLALDDNLEFKEILINEIFQSEVKERLVLDLLNESVNLKSRSTINLKSYVLENNILNQRDLDKLCREMPDLEIRLFSKDLSYRLDEEIKTKHLLFVLPEKNNKDIIIDKTYYFEEGNKKNWKGKSEPDFNVLVISRSEDVEILKSSNDLENHMKLRNGKIVENECGNIVFLNSFVLIDKPYSQIVSKSNSDLTPRSCERDFPLYPKETLVAFKSGSIFEGWFQSYGDFVCTAAWGVRTGPYTGVPSTLNMAFKLPKPLCNVWVPLNWELVPWNDDISRSMKYIWSEEDSGATITLGTTFGSSFKDVFGGAPFNATLTFSYSVKNDHDFVGEVIVQYCDSYNYISPVNKLGHRINLTNNVFQIHKSPNP